ncbi:MAG: hypothetical protein HY704_11095 [Gemmatimonadetes bacterium]|nr:hypothetical protein [Gemmatimonadota bacterium]
MLQSVAERLEVEGRHELARALYGLILERYAGTPSAAEAERHLTSLRGREEEGSGRVELIVWSTLYGLWLGVAVPAALGAEEPEAYGAGLLVGGPLGFIASRAYSDRARLGEGHARAITFGGMWGTWQGLGWREVLDLGTRTTRYCSGPGDSQPCYEDEEASSEVVIRAMLLGGLAGLGTGAMLARSRSITAGTATAVNFGALWGTWYGVATSILFDIEGDEALALTLLGGNAGLVTAAILAPRWDLSRPRARLISIAGVAGLVGGFGLDLILQPESERTAILLPMLGSAAGLAIGAAWSRGQDRRGEGVPESPGAALLEIRDGRLRLDLPLPLPAALPVERASGRGWEVGARLTLLDARF